MLVSLGLDFQRARLELRERFHLEEQDLPRIRAALATHGVRELVLTRTCNRIEMYCWWPEAGCGIDPARALCEAWVGEGSSEAEQLRAHARLRCSDEAVRHLLRVASGLESQILGDIHILGQVRRAFRDAVELEAVGTHLHRLFETALRVGKRVKRETQMLATRSGVGSEAAKRAVERLGTLAGRPCVVVGCGKSGTHAARSLQQRGAGDLALVNRTPERAEKLARDLGIAQALPLDALPGLLATAQLVVVATGAPQPVVTAAMLREARRASDERTLLLIDVSVPRNVEAPCSPIPGVELVDLDGLSPQTAEVERSRRASIPEAEAIVEDGIEEYRSWLELRAAGEALHPLRETLVEICRREVSYLTGESPTAHRTADRIAARLMARPMSALRAASKRGESVVDAVEGLGGLFLGPGHM